MRNFSQLLILALFLMLPIAAQATVNQVQTNCTQGSGSGTLATDNLTSVVGAGHLLIVYAADNNYPSARTLIGKALEPLSASEGEILVLLSLQ